MISVSSISKFLKLNSLKHSSFSNFQLFYCKNVATNKKSIEELFLSPDVQKILLRITGLNYDIIFSPKKREITPYKYEFVTDEGLKKLQEKARRRAITSLQMPPVLQVRKEISETLSKDPDLQGYVASPLYFIDISSTSTNRDRFITVRETDGTLRKANWQERDRMNQLYFPLVGRHIETPKLFENPYFSNLLDEGEYKFILDNACIQFEPDHPEYHRVTCTVYQHIKDMKKFDTLRSTRHFGPMAFYFACNNSIEPLLEDMIQRTLINDAADAVNLLYILNPELKPAKEVEMSELETVQDFIKNVSTKKDKLGMVLQTYIESQSVANMDEISNKVSN